MVAKVVVGFVFSHEKLLGFCLQCLQNIIKSVKRTEQVEDSSVFTRLLLYFKNLLHLSLTVGNQTSHVIVKLMSITNKQPLL